MKKAKINCGKEKVYALYKGEEYLYSGTVKEIAEKLNMRERTILFYKTPTYLKRREKSKKNNYFILIEIEED